MAGLVVVFSHYHRTQPLPDHMALNPFQAAGDAIIIEDAADFNSPIPPL